MIERDFLGGSMKRLNWYLSGVIFILVAVAVIYAINSMEDGTEDAALGESAPDFELRSLTGEVVKLSDYKGQKVMINFWATWCPPCEAEMPDIEMLHQQFPDYKILAINVDPENDIEGYIEQRGLTFPVLLEEKDQSGRGFTEKAYGVTGYPTTFFIDEQGILRKTRIGAMNFETMKSIMEKL